MRQEWKLNLFLLVVVSFGPALAGIAKGPPRPSLLGDSEEATKSHKEFGFTQSFYNASVAENSLASTMVIPSKGKMGIWNPEATREIHYSILSGDPHEMFRVESRQVGDFCFLSIKVRNNDRILNREFKEVYKIQIKAVVFENEVKIGNNTSQASALLQVQENTNRDEDFFESETESTKNLHLGSHVDEVDKFLLPERPRNPENLYGINEIGGSGSGSGFGSDQLYPDSGKQFILGDQSVGGDFAHADLVPSSSSSSVTDPFSKSRTRSREDLNIINVSDNNTNNRKASGSGGGRRRSLSQNENDGQNFASKKSSNKNNGRKNRQKARNSQDEEQQMQSSPRRTSRDEKQSSSGGSNNNSNNNNNNNRTRARNRTGGGNGESERRRNRLREKQLQVSQDLQNKIAIENPTINSQKSSGDSIKPIPTQMTTATTTTVKPTRMIVGPISTKRSKLIDKIEGRIPLVQAETIVFIRIIDVDDNQPVFESPTYDIGVNKDAPVLSKVAKINAADADVGKNSEIYYSLTEWNEFWSVDPITGVLSPTRPLVGRSKDRERETIRVRAKNRWNISPNSGSTANVNIHIRPVNRYAPQIRINRPPQVEVRPYGIIYAVVSVRDPDEGENGMVDLEIKEGDPNGIFRVNPTSTRNEFYVEMSPIVAVNFNKNSDKFFVFNLTLRASDRGVPVKSSEKELQVRVADVLWSDRTSNSAAVFDKDVYEVEISETSPPHSVVFRLKRPDSKVGLSISSGNEGEDFYLEEKSGVLYTSKFLDSESKSTYTLTIDSHDRRPSTNRIGDLYRRRQSVAKIIVKVIDGNDNSPEFEPFLNNKSEFSVLENEAVGSKVAKMVAKDRDSGENGYVTYSIANLKPTPFTIDHFTGEIRTSRLLDYEIDRREFTLKIRASDWGQPSRRQSQKTITIRLKDMNDNRPLFTIKECIAVIDRNIKFETELGKLEAIDFDREDVVTYRIVGGNDVYENTTVGTEVLTLKAKDMDKGYNGLLTFVISGGDEAHGAWDILNSGAIIMGGGNTDEASLVVAAPLDREEIGNYVLTISVWDQGKPPKYTSRLLKIKIRDSNDCSPMFTKSAMKIKIGEGSELVGKQILQVTAYDEDEAGSPNSLINYRLLNESPEFSIDDKTGTIRLIRDLDRERQDLYELFVVAEDSGSPKLSSIALVSIQIEDKNDERPKFEIFGPSAFSSSSGSSNSASRIVKVMEDWRCI